MPKIRSLINTKFAVVQKFYNCHSHHNIKEIKEKRIRKNATLSLSNRRQKLKTGELKREGEEEWGREQERAVKKKQTMEIKPNK